MGSRARGHALVFIWESGGAHSHASDCADCGRLPGPGLLTPRPFPRAQLTAQRVAWPVHLHASRLQDHETVLSALPLPPCIWMVGIAVELDSPGLVLRHLAARASLAALGSLSPTDDMAM